MNHDPPAGRWDEGLEGSPRRIAETLDSPLRVVAGPGTGKTFSLMRRVARLLQEGADPRRILICTFTRTAAADLARALARIGIEATNNIRAGTLHAYCFGLLSAAEVLPLTGRHPRPLMRFEEWFLVEDLQGEGFGGRRDRRRRLEAFNAAWARLQSDEPGWPTEDVDMRFHRTLLDWLTFHKAMLVGELVPETLQFLRNNPASPHRGAFDHVLIDEYQDLNRSDQVLLDLLAEAGTMTVIGDEDQSLYSFRYAHPEGISRFHQTHPGTHDERLDECRRCPSLVVTLANALIENNTAREARALLPREGNPAGEVLVVQWPGLDEEARGVARFIQSRIAGGRVAVGNVLVLAPRRQLGYGVRDALKALSVPAHSFFHEQALDGNPRKMPYSRAEQAFTLLSLLARADDTVALRAWCGFGHTTLRSNAWLRIIEHSRNAGDDPWMTLERLVTGAIKIPHTGSLVQRFEELRQALAPLRDLTGGALMNALFPQDQEWATSFRSLTSGIDEGLSAGDLREALRIGITQPELPTDVDYVRVMSLHKSKGLTADLVVVVGCLEGLVPTLPNEGSQAEQHRLLEEQRRLFYVAITRTTATLVLSSVSRVPRLLGHRLRIQVRGAGVLDAPTLASRFLHELGPSRPAAIEGASLFQ